MLFVKSMLTIYLNGEVKLVHLWLFMYFIYKYACSMCIRSENLSSSPVCSWDCVARTLVLSFVFFVIFLLFRHCIVCPSSIYGFWLVPSLFSGKGYISLSLCFIDNDIHEIDHQYACPIRYYLIKTYPSLMYTYSNFSSNSIELYNLFSRRLDSQWVC